MFLVIDAQNVIKYALEIPPVLTETGLDLGDVIDGTLTLANASVVEFVGEMPKRVIPNKYKLVGGGIVNNPEYVPSQYDLGLILTHEEFSSRLTPEDIEMITAAVDLPDAMYFVNNILTPQSSVVISDDRLVRCLNKLVEANIITANRKDILLTPKNMADEDIT